MDRQTEARDECTNDWLVSLRLARAG